MKLFPECEKVVWVKVQQHVNPLTKQELKKAANSLKVEKAFVLDGLRAETVKMLLELAPDMTLEALNSI